MIVKMKMIAAPSATHASCRWNACGETAESVTRPVVIKSPRGMKRDSMLSRRVCHHFRRRSIHAGRRGIAYRKIFCLAGTHVVENSLRGADRVALRVLEDSDD